MLSYILNSHMAASLFEVSQLVLKTAKCIT